MSPFLPVCRRHAAAFAAALLLAVLPPRPAAAQVTRTLTACAPGALALCAELRLTATPSLFELGIRTIGATSQPTIPVSVYNLVFGTGRAASASPLATSVIPVGGGGASVIDASAWELFDAGDALFLSALTNLGVGGCASGAAVDGFGQAARTCGAGEFVSFAFTPLAAYDPSRFTLLNLEAVVLTDPVEGASCGAEGSACAITSDVTVRGDPSTTVPEPGTLALLAAGLVIAVIRRAVGRRGA